MSIKAHLEQAIKSLQTEKQSVANAVKERVTREKILPYNQDIDMARDKAIEEKQANLNATIVAHQEQFAKDKREIIEAAQKKKEENAASVITSETYMATVEYDKAIAKLTEQVAELKD